MGPTTANDLGLTSNLESYLRPWQRVNWPSDFMFDFELGRLPWVDLEIGLWPIDWPLDLEVHLLTCGLTSDQSVDLYPLGWYIDLGLTPNLRTLVSREEKTCNPRWRHPRVTLLQLPATRGRCCPGPPGWRTSSRAVSAATGGLPSAPARYQLKLFLLVSCLFKLIHQLMFMRHYRSRYLE